MRTLVFDPKSGSRVPVRVWARVISKETEKQLQLLARRPFVVEHVAVKG